MKSQKRRLDYQINRRIKKPKEVRFRKLKDKEKGFEDIIIQTKQNELWELRKEIEMLEDLIIKAMKQKGKEE